MPAAASPSASCRAPSSARRAGSGRPGPGATRSRGARARAGCARVAGRSWNGTSGMFAAAPSAVASSAASRATALVTRPSGPLRPIGSGAGDGRGRSGGEASNPVCRTIGHRPRSEPAGSGIDPGTAPGRVGFRWLAFILGPSIEVAAVAPTRSPREHSRTAQRKRERRTGAGPARPRRGDVAAAVRNPQRQVRPFRSGPSLEAVSRGSRRPPRPPPSGRGSRPAPPGCGRCARSRR